MPMKSGHLVGVKRKGSMVQRLSVVESQRIMAIMEETLEKLAFLGSITPDVLQHRDELSQFVGDEISRIIMEQRTLETRYEELIAQRGALKGLANKSKYRENQIEIQEVSRALRESTKNLCRNLKDNPDIGGNLEKIQDERQALQDLLSRTLIELRDGTFGTLVAQVEEDKQAQHRIAEIVRREKETTTAVKQLDQDLGRERLEHLREVQEQKAAIAQLKEQLQQIKSKTSVDTKYAKREARSQTASTLRTYQQSILEYDKNIQHLQKKRAMEEVVHDQTVTYLTRAQERLAEECGEWSQRYAVECEDKEAELRDLTAKRDTNLQRLTLLQRRWEQELAEKTAKEAEEKRVAELEQLRREEEERHHVACAKIQKLFRSYMLRKAEDEKKRESEKKSKKKGGKKGKKKK